MTINKKILSLIAILCFLPTLAFALSLDEAKNKGLVGETPSGYLASASGSSSVEVKALVQEINAKRKAKYSQIAQGNNTPLATVEKLAGKKAINNTASGNLVQAQNGSWVKK